MSKQPFTPAPSATPVQSSVWERPTYNPSKHGNSVPVRKGADDHLKILSKGNLT